MDAVFIVGTGRSGTHFTCRSILGFSNAFDPHNGRECLETLRSVAQAAIQHKKYPKTVYAYYQKQLSFLEKGKIFVDQHHPNIFFTDVLKEIFESPVFLYPKRDIEQVVASMINHPGVLAWYDYAKRNRKLFGFISKAPFPNKFLGLKDFKLIDELPLHLLCAMRVLVHDHVARELTNSCNFKVVEYQSLVKDQLGTFNNIFGDQVELFGKFTEVEKSNLNSLKKYTETLTPKQVEEIRLLESEFDGAIFEPFL